MTHSGVDSYSHADGASLAAAGIEFSVRYLSRVQDKAITRAEADDLHAHGLQIVSVFEDNARRPLDGHQAGVDDANYALAQGAGAGMPDGAVVYFAVDFDVQAAEQPAVNEYLQGAAAVLGGHRVGVYGGYYTVKRALDAGAAAYAWQTTAWSGDQWDPRTQLRQDGGIVTIGGVEYDRNTALVDDYGQWQPVAVAPPWPGRYIELTQPRMHGNDIAQWQQRMQDRGWNLGPDGVDGVWGPAMDDVLRKFQAEKSLTQDGVLGPKSWAAAWTTPVTP